MQPDPDRAPSDAEAQLVEEFERQRRHLEEENWIRLPATALALSVALIYLPPSLMLLCALGDALGEILSLAILRSDLLRLVRSRWRRALLLFASALALGSFCVPTVLLWHESDAYAKALAVGMLVSAMMHLATTRAIHLPIGLTGWAVSTALATYGNAHFWVMQGEWLSLAITSVTLGGACTYFVSALLTNNRLHRETLAGKRAAQAASAAKGRLLAHLSHELRTPLNAILGLSHAERRQTTAPQTRARMEVIVGSAEGMATLLNDILDLSAIESGQLPIRNRPSVPAEAIETSVALWRLAFEEAGLTCELAIDEGLRRPALIDELRLRQCLSNLLSNALRHCRTGGVRLTAELTVCPARGNDWLRATVADSGPGVPEAVRARIFEPFVTYAAAGPDGAHGHGIGLSISRELARQMGGDLTLEPTPPGEAGARFLLLLPAPPCPMPEAGPAEVPATATAATDLLAGRQFLVVDDIATNRLVASTCLRLLGADCVEAESGAAALDLLRARRFDAVLLDMNMPELDGVETFRRIRALPGAGGQLPVVAMTANALPDHRSAYLTAGLDAHLAKPVTPDRLAEVLPPLLSGQPESEPNPAALGGANRSVPAGDPP